MILINANVQPADEAFDDDHHHEESLRICAELERLGEYSTENITRCTELVRRLKKLGKRIKKDQQRHGRSSTR